MLLLAPYQQRWISDRNRRRIANKSRRIGFSFASTLRRAKRATYNRTDQYLISASERQSKALLRTCKTHIQLFEKYVGARLIKEWSETRGRLMNGATLHALAANPASIRGDGGDVLLDEFAHHKRSKEIWAAAKALADPHLGRPDGYELEIVSTPFGDDKDNMFHSICQNAASMRFSLHTITIYDALADGFPVDLEQAKADYGDPDIFAQECCCSFLSSSMRYISAALWDSMTYEPQNLPAPSGVPPRFAGMDVGRRNDPSCIVEAERRGDILWQMALAEYRRRATWDDQEAWLDDTMTRCQRMAVDGSGLGIQFGERMTARYPTRVEAVDFTSKSKEMLATGLKLALERGRLRPLTDDVDLRRDVLNLRRDVTDFGTVRFDAPRTKEGHADGAWALALMVHAAGGAVREPASPDLSAPPPLSSEVGDAW